MKVLVTGASGLLGGHVVRQLFVEGYKVRLFLRKSAEMTGLLGFYDEIVYGDIENQDDVDEAVQGCDFVIHAASLTAGVETNYHYYEKTNVNGTVHIINASLKFAVKKLVYVSTANTIGPGSQKKPGTELSDFSLFYINSGYINSKFLAQQYVLEQVEKSNLPAVVVNPTFMIGPYDYKPSSGKMILHAFKNIQVFPSGGKNFIGAKDAAKGVILSLQNGRVGEMYLLAGENLSYKAFLNKLNKVAGIRPFKIIIPRAAFICMGFVGSLINKLFNVRASLNYPNAMTLTLDNYYSGNKACRELGLQVSPIEEVLQESLEWFKVYHLGKKNLSQAIRKEKDKKFYTLK